MRERILAVGLMGLFFAACADMKAEAAKAEQGLKVEVLLKIQKSDDKTPVPGAYLKCFAQGAWHDFAAGPGTANAKRAESGAKFSVLDERGGKWKGRQINYSCSGTVQLGRKQRKIGFRVLKKGFVSAYFSIRKGDLKGGPKYYHEISLEPHEKTSHWPFGAAEDATLKETTGKGTSGKIIGAAWAKDQGVTALKFDGEDDVVDCRMAPGYEPKESISVLLWVKPGAQISTMQGLVGRAWKNPWALYTVKGNGLEAAVFLDGFGYVYLTQRQCLKIGEWNLVGFAYEDDRISLYHSGKRIAAGASVCPRWDKEEVKVDRISPEVQPRRFRKSFPPPYRLLPSNQPLSIGYFDSVAHFRGLIRGVRIYNYALEEAQIRKIHETEAPK